ncbi:fibrobacter succinogenes major paralogous domain-containing protein [bacterium]|nr:fibrobacter succinogenes major paralogous domain-containing protein [bacterium]
MEGENMSRLSHCFLITLLALAIFCVCDNKNPTESKESTVTDIDGNVYKTIKIGDQWWMAENLRVTHYRNGDEIPNVTKDLEWRLLSTSGYCVYDNNESNAEIYGYLYNWYAVNDTRKLAPEEWHVPSNDEWQTLVDYLGGDYLAGGKMKETGSTHWKSRNIGATNESGFTALPCGCRTPVNNGFFVNLGINTNFWASDEYNADSAWHWSLSYDDTFVGHGHSNKRFGYSVRCIKDN